MVEFTKASGAGNDFVIINDLAGDLQSDHQRLAVALCSRHFGVGADGLLILQRSDQADFLMRYYNADGSSGGMCGNGGRCVARYAFLNRISGSKVAFEALDHIYHAEVKGETVRLRMKDPSDLRTGIELHTEDGSYQGDYVDTGSPHVVILTKSLQTINLSRIGLLIRNLGTFAPGGTNVNFVTPLMESSIQMRTYERGVEAETLACGTGAVASALVSHLRRQSPSPISVKVQSGETLQVYFTYAQDRFSQIILEGSAHILFNGKLMYDTIAGEILD